ncbi:hypothetical protein PoB_004037100 [Plakobranchus ocellatus]|uniref:Major facilitator superfamily (MFS) profile domain-containing protein n=1 Tax=Plakobranchus ocellatus TaxID=259542 RepID=A0AAV4B008_9GAST|nr:hypothetical protein PoB_004037100 [Plakobranchus ocellatus]
MKFDDVFSEVGEFGYYQKQIYLLTCLAPICVSMQVLAGVFIQATPDHRCSLPDLPNDTYASQGLWHDALVNASIPWDDDDEKYDQCKLRRVPGRLDDDTVSCEKWVYSKDPFKSTFVTDGDFVCDDSILVTYASMIFMCGMLFGSLVLGILADTIGRKKIMILSTLCLMASSLGVAWADSYALFVTLKFLALFFATGMMLAAFVIGMEIVGPSKRRLAGNIGNFFWVSGLFLETGMAYWLRDWKHFQIAISIILAVSLLILAGFLPESPRWLLQRGKTKEAGEIIQKMAERNGLVLSPKIRQLNNVTFESNNTQSVWHIFTYRSLVLRSFIMFYNW